MYRCTVDPGTAVLEYGLYDMSCDTPAGGARSAELVRGGHWPWACARQRSAAGAARALKTRVFPSLSASQCESRTKNYKFGSWRKSARGTVVRHWCCQEM